MSNKNISNSFEEWITNDTFNAKEVLLDEHALFLDAQKRTLQLFHAASKRVPAYKDFLSKHNINPSSIHTVEDFNKIPAITKKNYIDTYETKDRCWDGKLDTMHMLSTSSGTTGQPYFWPRDLLSEIEGAYFYEFMYKFLCQADKKKTLFINGFAMGTWIAGTFTLDCTNLVAWKGYPITSITPGYDVAPIIQILKLLPSHFDQVVIVGFVPFLKEIVETALQEGIDLKRMSLILIGTGQGITENWRTYIQNQLSDDEAKQSVFNIYGSADASIMAVETHLSVALRKKINSQQSLKTAIFSRERLPSLYNFDPRLTYFEEINGELHVTKNSGCPLIRYNMLDEGGVISHDAMLAFFPELVTQVYDHKLPFVYLFGRDKFMVKIYGANIYTEHVQQALNHKDLQHHISGRYITEVVNDEEENPRLICRIELNYGVAKDEELAEKIKKIFIEEVRKINSEYNDVLKRMGVKVEPHIQLYEKNHPDYFPKGVVKKTN